MAATDSRPLPIRATAYRVIFPIMDADGDLVTGATGLDSEVSKDCGTFADCTNEATEIATSSGIYYLDLTSTEMTADSVAVIVKTTSSGAKTTTLVMYPVEAGDIDVDVTSWNGTAVATPDTAGYPKVTIKDGTGTGELDTASGGVLVASIATGAITATSIAADAITDAKVASDVTIASVTGAVGSVTGAVGSVTGAVGSVTGAVGSVTGNVGGNVTGSVGSVATGGITAASFAADAITAAKIAADVTTELQSGLATAASIAALNNLSAAQVNAEVDTALADVRLDELLAADSDIDGLAPPTVGSVFHELMSKTAGSFTYDQTTDSNEALRDNLATATALATAQTSIDDIPTNAELATSQASADDATLAAIAALTIPSAATIADAVWDEDATAHQTQGTFGQAIGDPVADTNTIYKAVVTDAAGATVGVDVVAVKAETAAILDDTDDIGVAGAGLTALASQSSVTTLATYVDTEVGSIITTLGTPAGASISADIAAIEAQTDDIGAAGAGLTALATAASIAALNNLSAAQVTAAVPTAAQNADALLDRNIAGGSNGGRDVTSALQALRNKQAISGGTLTVYAEDDTTSAWTATVTTTAGNPISSVDPV